jgi:hypothetical protein
VSGGGRKGGGGGGGGWLSRGFVVLAVAVTVTGVPLSLPAVARAVQLRRAPPVEGWHAEAAHCAASAPLCHSGPGRGSLLAQPAPHHSSHYSPAALPALLLCPHRSPRSCCARSANYSARNFPAVFTAHLLSPPTTTPTSICYRVHAQRPPQRPPHSRGTPCDPVRRARRPPHSHQHLGTLQRSPLSRGAPCTPVRRAYRPPHPHVGTPHSPLQRLPQ